MIKKNKLVIFAIYLFFSLNLFSEIYIGGVKLEAMYNAEYYFTNKAELMLVKAATIGNKKGMDKAIELGADVNAVGKDEATPLIWTLVKQNKTGFEYLLQKGANPNYRRRIIAL